MNTTRRDFLKVGAGAVAATSCRFAKLERGLLLYSIREISMQRRRRTRAT